MQSHCDHQGRCDVHFPPYQPQAQRQEGPEISLTFGQGLQGCAASFWRQEWGGMEDGDGQQEAHR